MLSAREKKSCAFYGVCARGREQKRSAVVRPLFELIVSVLFGGGPSQICALFIVPTLANLRSGKCVGVDAAANGAKWMRT